MSDNQDNQSASTNTNDGSTRVNHGSDRSDVAIIPGLVSVTDGPFEGFGFFPAEHQMLQLSTSAQQACSEAAPASAGSNQDTTGGASVQSSTGASATAGQHSKKETANGGSDSTTKPESK